MSDAKLFNKYREKIRSLVEIGQAEVVPVEELVSSDKIFYIPHHCTGAKFRVVFDCGASYCGVSLNKMLLQGPDLTNNLVDVLLRFRQEAVAVAVDIKGMFL